MFAVCSGRLPRAGLARATALPVVTAGGGENVRAFTNRPVLQSVSLIVGDLGPKGHLPALPAHWGPIALQDRHIHV